STASGARRYPSAKCAVPQSTAVTVTRLRSAGGRSVTHSPTCRSIHFSVREPAVAGEARAVAFTAVVGVATLLLSQAPRDAAAHRPHNARMHRTRIAVQFKHPDASRS